MKEFKNIIRRRYNGSAVTGWRLPRNRSIRAGHAPVACPTHGLCRPMPNRIAACLPQTRHHTTCAVRVKTCDSWAPSKAAAASCPTGPEGSAELRSYDASSGAVTSPTDSDNGASPRGVALPLTPLGIGCGSSNSPPWPKGSSSSDGIVASPAVRTHPARVAGAFMAPLRSTSSSAVTSNASQTCRAALDCKKAREILSSSTSWAIGVTAVSRPRDLH